MSSSAYKKFMIILGLVACLSLGNTLYDNQQLQQEVESLNGEIVSMNEEIDSLEDSLFDVESELANKSKENNDLDFQNAELLQQIEKMKQDADFEYQGKFTVTYYCGEDYPHICGTGNGVTSSGAKAFAGVTVAADPNVFPTGSYIYIEGVGMRVVQDTGGGIKGNKLDVYVDTHNEALENDVKNVGVWLVTKGDN